MWLAPWFLLGLAGLAVPLWLHRFARQTEQKQPFASLMFLEASEVRRSRRHELRYWLLLALRLLLLALIALAFAGPLWRMVTPANGKGVATLHVIALDTSMSMNHDGNWERAQQSATQLAGAVRGADRAMLVAADNKLLVLQQPVFAGQAGMLTGAIAALKPGYSRLDYGALVSGSAGWGAGPGERVVLHLVTDLQQSASPLRFADLQPPPGVTLDLVDVGSDSPGNLRVAGVELAPRNAGEAVVRLEGDAAAAKGRSLVIEVNGVERARRTLPSDLSLPTAQRFEVGDLGEGEHRLSARLVPADSLPQDDAYFALVRRVEPRVLLIAAAANGDDAVYLRAALQSLENPRFNVEVAAAASAATRSLAQFAAVVVSDAGVLNSVAAQSLTKYVNAGGAVLLTLGPRALQLPAVPLSGAKLATGRARAAGNEPARVAEVEQSHPVLRDPGLWRTIQFFRHVPVQAPDGAAVLMRFENGTPLLLEQQMQTGKILVLASPLDRAWNDLAIHPLFVQFVAEATAYLAGARAEAATATVGAALESDLARRGGGQVFDPAGKRTVMLDGATAGPRLVPEMPGYYEVRGGGRSDFIAVNVDARESSLTRLDEGARTRWLALKAAAATSGPQIEGANARAQPGTRLIPVWFWLLLAACVLAFIEPLVANYHLHVLREGRS
ncbi:MAG: VWA domain-containing protein [Pseudomonadota bacterium]